MDIIQCFMVAEIVAIVLANLVLDGETVSVKYGVKRLTLSLIFSVPFALRIFKII